MSKVPERTEDMSSTATQTSTSAAELRQRRPAESAARARERGKTLGRLLYLGDTAVALVAATITVGVLDLGTDLRDAAIYVLCVGLIWPTLAFVVGLYRTDQLASWASGVVEVPRLLVALLVVTWPLYLIGRVVGLDKPVLVAFLIMFLIGICGGISRMTIRAHLHHTVEFRQRTLILGSGVVAGQVVKKLRNNDQFGLLPVGIVDDDLHDVGTPNLPWLGKFSELESIIENRQIDRVIIAFSRASHEQLLESIRACRDAGVAIDVVPRLFEFLDGVRSLDQVGGLPLLSIGPAHLTAVAMTAKRIMDVCVSAIALIVLSPLLLGTAIAIKLESPGPVFFRQLRAGRDTKGFHLIKFRSMYVDAEDRKKEMELLNESRDGVMFKIQEDPRITRVGRFIRRYSIDELPQLINVLAGEMSLVGPRPLIFPEAAALETQWHLRRLELRPGLTGPWQIYGRSQSPFQEMVRFDYQYVAGWSLARDFELLLGTIPAVISGRGAY
jgi:exopolysaccharide biosynthesis polyprenyl glycosylphosphotransferase